MKKYIAHIRAKSTHQRREHAMQVASAVTAVVFVVWVGTLGVRLAVKGGSGQTASADNQTQTASVAAGADNQAAVASAQSSSANTLEVATTSVFSQ